MKKLAVCLMIFAMLLSAACGKQTQTPTEPTPPVTEAPTEAPTQPVTEPATQAPTEVPAEPATEPVTEPVTEAPTEMPTEPVAVEPEGAVSAVKLPAEVPEVEQVVDFLPLQGGASVLLAKSGSKGWLMTYDYTVSEVIHRLEVKVGADARLSLMDASTLYYYDGQKSWEVTVSGRMNLSAKAYDSLPGYKMGEHTLAAPEGGITLDGKPIAALQPSGRLSYALVRVLDDHRLLYYATNHNIPSLSHYGVYDHDIGEARAVTTMGQEVIGNWGERLLVGFWAENGWYKLAQIKLDDMSCTELSIDCDTPQQAVAYMELNREGTRLTTGRQEETGYVVRVYDVPECQLLYQWTLPDDGMWNWSLIGESSIAFWKKEAAGITVWSVEY